MKKYKQIDNNIIILLKLLILINMKEDLKLSLGNTINESGIIIKQSVRVKSKKD
jgi:hypothetical protein